MKKTFSIKTLGCKLNQYESALIVQQFEEAGWAPVPFGDPADAVIVNTCTVTDRSDKKCRNYIRQAARFSIRGGAIVTGCMAERDGEGLAGMPEVLAVFDNADKKMLLERVENLLFPEEQALSVSGKTGFREEPLPFNRTRGFLRVQDGCDGACSYCIVPAVRGAASSREFHEVISHARHLIESGCPELVLTGITIGSYMSGGNDIAGLVEALAELPGAFRIRVTSIEPKHVSNALAGLFRHPKICRHLHLPLQSGSDRVLRSMNRPYTVREYLSVVEMLRASCPEMALGADIIIGFPGETEDDFAESMHVAGEAGFSYIHQFSFSPRRGTPAAGLGGACAERTTAERSRRMRHLSDQLGLAYRRGFVGSVLPCIIEKNRSDGGLTAVSDTYIKMSLAADEGAPAVEGKIVGVRLLETGTGGSAGAVVTGS
jgi:threonylcarbamoyladenosine tRNA methylthiotransferase MtaB